MIILLQVAINTLVYAEIGLSSFKPQFSHELSAHNIDSRVEYAQLNQDKLLDSQPGTIKNKTEQYDGMYAYIILWQD